MDMLINQTGGIFSQCTCIRTHHNIHFECLTLLFVNHTSKLKLKKKKLPRENVYSMLPQISFLDIHGKPWNGEEKIIHRQHMGWRGEIWGWVEGSVAGGKEGLALCKRTGCLRFLGAFPEEGRRVARSLFLLWSYSASRSQIKGRAATCGFCCTQRAGGLPNGKGDCLPQSRMTWLKRFTEEDTGPRCRNFAGSA